MNRAWAGDKPPPYSPSGPLPEGKMKVLFVYQHLILGGCESVLRARVEGLLAHGVLARAWFLNDGAGRRLFAGWEDFLSVGPLERLCRFVERADLDLVSVLDTDEALPTLGRVFPGPLVVEVHSSYEARLEGLRSLDRARIAAFLAPSRHQAERVRERIGPEASLFAVPNPLSAEFTDAPTPPSEPRQGPVIAWIGRLDENKNWTELINIARLLSTQHERVRFWIAGREGDPRVGDELYERLQQERLLERFRWFRGVDRKRLVKLLDAVRDSGGAILSTSRRESFGMTIAEALARGCAVVVPDRPPLSALVRHQDTGLCYRPEDPADGAEQLSALLTDASLRLRLAAAGRERVLAAHAPGPSITALFEVLERIGKTTTPRPGSP